MQILDCNRFQVILGNNQKYEVLEIGCGIGILLAAIKEKYPNISLEGIEPYKGGFDRLKATKSLIPNNIGIKYLKFEDFEPKKNMISYIL